MRIAVLGAGGKMGRAVIEAVDATPDLELVAAIDQDPRSIPGPATMQRLSTIEELGEVDVVVDFTVASAARVYLPQLLRRNIAVVSGTTGLSEVDLLEIEKASSEGNCAAVVAANFAIGAVLLMKFAEMAAPYFSAVEIIELHHDEKKDAPSGTAMVTAERIARSRSEAGMPGIVDPTEHEVLGGARGAVGPGGVHLHSVRLPGFVAHEEVILGDQGQSLTLRHDSMDRSSFMAGVLLAVRNVGGMHGLTRGIESLLT
jgi:4-hydroxy-tetrahydrodipicolinate reductase